jgi:hypothetical protein
MYTVCKKIINFKVTKKFEIKINLILKNINNHKSYEIIKIKSKIKN